MRKKLVLPGVGIAAAVIAIVAILIVVGGGSDGDTVPVPSALASVCSQTEATASADQVEVDLPKPGDAVTSPLHVTGKVNAIDGVFYISLVTADGTHVIDYPGRVSQSGELVSFDQQVPFSYFEQAPACLWVYRENIDKPDSVRIPIVIQPVSSPTNGGQ
jgi:hypothetical protein